MGRVWQMDADKKICVYLPNPENLRPIPVLFHHYLLQPNHTFAIQTKVAVP